MKKTALFCAALAAEAAAFAPSMSPMGGARLLGATTPRAVGLAAARAPRCKRAAAPALRAQLGLNDKDGGTAVDDFKRDGKVRRACLPGSPLPCACPSPERCRAARLRQRPPADQIMLLGTSLTRRGAVPRDRRP
jgi:hypothetical protein